MTDKQTLIEGLNKDLAAEYQAVIMYTTYAAEVSGIYRKELEGFFQAEVAEELGHARYLANKISALGGTPATEPAGVPHHDNVRDMLEEVRQAEADTIKRYARRKDEAEEAGEFGLANDLEDMISDETRHREECEKMLRGSWK